MATFDVAKLLNKITQDIPGINTVLKALANWDVSALSDVPDGAMQATTDANNNLTIKKKVSGSYTPVTKLMHDVDKLDGYHASASATANAVAVRNAQGALPGNILGNAVTADTATALAAGSVVPVNQGGTGATTASQARANLGVAGGADFTTHVATQASPSVEGHVKLDALAADGSNTAAPGGYGLGKTLSTVTDFNNCVVNGWYYGSNSAANRPPVATNYHVFVQALNSSNVLQKAYQVSGNSYYTRVCSSGVWSAWVLKPIGITDSTSTTSSNIAASATAVKTAYDKAASALGRTDPATTTSRGIGRVATLADMEPGAVIANGPAVLAAGDVVSVIEKWRFIVGEFYYFRHPTLKPGFAPLQGGLISGAYQGKNITEYPIWAYLQTTEGQKLCKTESQWQAMTTATWHTNADGSKVGWGGIGGAPFYVQDLGAGTLRLPDLRGMYAEAAGFDSLGVGGVDGDRVRNWTGGISVFWNDGVLPSGAIYATGSTNGSAAGSGAYYTRMTIDPSRVVPTGNANAPRRWGALACCWLGQVI